MLAPMHARVIALADEGLDTRQLADRLRLDPSAVEPLLRVAREKLARIEALDERPEGHVQDADATT
jgi:DNA-directed RNA polymerase specialized sigma24 family protein